MSLKEKMGDALWRITHLYKIKDKRSGRLVLFQPNSYQQEILEALALGEKKIVVLKARQLGMSTLMSIYMLDQMIWNKAWCGTILDQSVADAAIKLNGIMKPALENLPSEIKSRVKVIRSNDSILEVSVNGDSSSAIHAGTHARGGTNNMLLVSEWGVIQNEDEKRSNEILTGALPSAEAGITVVETTWQGPLGESGIARIVRTATETAPEHRAPGDWRLFFFPWWKDTHYSREGNPESIAPENHLYFERLEKEHKVILNEGQQLWYDRTQKQLGENIYREYPSLLEECWQVPVKGSVFGKLIGEIRSKGRIREIPVNGDHLVHTFWDLGSPANTVVWFVQFIAGEVRVVDLIHGADHDTMRDLLNAITMRGYSMGVFYLPHDAAHRDSLMGSPERALKDAGVRNIRVVPKIQSKVTGIDYLKEILKRVHFCGSKTARGIEALELYRYSDDGTYLVHDASSHYADALRCMAEAVEAGMVEEASWAATSKLHKKRSRGVTVTMGLSDNYTRTYYPKPSRGDDVFYYH